MRFESAEYMDDFTNGRFVELEKRLSMRESDCSDSAEYWNFRGSVQIANNQLEKAKRSFIKSDESSPTWTAKFNISQTNMTLGEFELASEEFHQLIAGAPSSTHAGLCKFGYALSLMFSDQAYGPSDFVEYGDMIVEHLDRAISQIAADQKDRLNRPAKNLDGLEKGFLEMTDSALRGRSLRGQ